MVVNKIRSTLTMELKTSIGVVFFNQAFGDIQTFFQSLRTSSQQSGASCSVRTYVINNGNSLPCELKDLEPDCIELPSLGNIGFGKAMNILMEAAFRDGADVFVTANPDGAFHHQTLAKMTAMHRSSRNALIEARQFPEEHPKVYDTVTLDTPWGSGCCLLVPKIIYETIGGFDDNFFLYMEDVDLSWRARLAGFSVKVCPDAFFFHHVLNREPNPKVLEYMYLSARYLAFKWGNHLFRKKCEDQLVQAFRYTSETLPELIASQATYADKVEAQAVVCFHREFSFAEVRW